MGATIKKLTIEGYKSIRKLEDFELRALNIVGQSLQAGRGTTQLQADHYLDAIRAFVE